MARPTLYDPKHCDLAVKLGKLGKSKTQIAAKIGVHRGTLGDWAARHAEFAEAVLLSQTLSEAHWEDKGEVLTVEKPGGMRINAHMWTRSMAARFPERYRERTETKLDAGADLASLIAASMKPSGE